MSEKLMISTTDMMARLLMQGLREIADQEQKLSQDFETARNMACSELTVSPSIVGSCLIPNKMLPKTMELLRKNFRLLQEELSFSRYCLIEAFKGRTGSLVRLDKDQEGCYEYWSEKLKGILPKTKFELVDRFAGE